jgi:predicted acylesterase/phospholipase RssA
MTPVSSSIFFQQTYQTVVFAGGGNRCWWQAGVVETLSKHASWQVKQLIGASAGAGIATAFATGRIHDALECAIRRFNATSKNVIWKDLFKGKRPFVLPRIYPDWIESFLKVPDLNNLRRSPLSVKIAITRPIPLLPVALSTAIALALYSTEKFWLKTFHSRVPHWAGLRAEYLDIASCSNLQDARSLLLGSAAAVPITPTHLVAGRPALDGGFYDNVPLPQNRSDDASTLVLLTRHRSDLPRAFRLNEITYFQPSRPVAATNMDCTSGDNVQSTYLQGVSDTVEWLKQDQ